MDIKKLIENAFNEGYFEGQNAGIHQTQKESSNKYWESIENEFIRQRVRDIESFTEQAKNSLKEIKEYIQARKIQLGKDLVEDGHGQWHYNVLYGRAQEIRRMESIFEEITQKEKDDQKIPNS